MYPSQKEAIRIHTLELEMCKKTVVVGGTQGFSGRSEQSWRQNTHK